MVTYAWGRITLVLLITTLFSKLVLVRNIDEIIHNWPTRFTQNSTSLLYPIVICNTMTYTIYIHTCIYVAIQRFYIPIGVRRSIQAKWIPLTHQYMPAHLSGFVQTLHYNFSNCCFNSGSTEMCRCSCMEMENWHHLFCHNDQLSYDHNHDDVLINIHL
jgi:hypothetical protein